MSNTNKKADTDKPPRKLRAMTEKERDALTLFLVRLAADPKRNGHMNYTQISEAFDAVNPDRPEDPEKRYVTDHNIYSTGRKINGFIVKHRPAERKAVAAPLSPPPPTPVAPPPPAVQAPTPIAHPTSLGIVAVIERLDQMEKNLAAAVKARGGTDKDLLLTAHLLVNELQIAYNNGPADLDAYALANTPPTWAVVAKAQTWASGVFNDPPWRVGTVYASRPEGPEIAVSGSMICAYVAQRLLDAIK